MTEPIKPWKMVREWMYAGPTENRSLFGCVGRSCIGHGDQMYCERLLAEHQEWTTIVELGTGSGLCTLWFAICMNLRDGVVYTYDQKRPQPYFIRNWPHGVVYKQGDMYEPPIFTEILELAGKPNTLVICDGAKKTEEVDMIMPHIAVGNGIMCHDWAAEVDHQRIYDLAHKWHCEPLLHDFAHAVIGRYRAWRKFQ